MIIEVVREWFDAFAARDMTLARRMFPDDAVLHLNGVRRVYRGLDELLAWYQDKIQTAGEVSASSLSSS